MFFWSTVLVRINVTITADLKHSESLTEIPRNAVQHETYEKNKEFPSLRRCRLSSPGEIYINFFKSFFLLLHFDIIHPKAKRSARQLRKKKERRENGV